MGRKYLIRNIWHSYSKVPSWRPVLPTKFEVPVLNVVHAFLVILEQKGVKIHDVKSGRLFPAAIYANWLNVWTAAVHSKVWTTCQIKPGRSVRPLPTDRCSCRRILMPLYMFYIFVKFYALRAGTTRNCLNRILGRYVIHVARPNCNLTDNDAQITSPGISHNWA